jgi:two-component system, NtrC family, sensor histidine kinase HydH
MSNKRLVLLAAVFLASLAALVASTAIAIQGSTDELAARDQLRAAAGELSTAGQDVSIGMLGKKSAGVLSETDNRRLAAAVGQVLANYPNAEGGFYLADSDQFAGTVGVGPSTASESKLSPIEKEVKAVEKRDKKAEKKKADKGENGKSLPVTGRRDPPPLETPSIRQQCRDALTLEVGSPALVDIRDVGPSRVAVATAPVGDNRPARVAVWVMLRLTGPEQQKARLDRLQIATGLSLAGILLALGLSIVLVRSLQREERKRALLGDELRKSEYLAALGRMLAGVAHEVRNPLSAIQSTVQLWERLPDQSRTPESLAAVVRGVGRLNELVSRLLLFARAGHEARRPLNLNAVTAETLELIRARAEAQNVHMEADLTSGMLPIAGAAQAIGQVILNLVTNALQAMPSAGHRPAGLQIDGLVRRRVDERDDCARSRQFAVRPVEWAARVSGTPLVRGPSAGPGVNGLGRGRCCGEQSGGQDGGECDESHGGTPRMVRGWSR